MIRLEDIKKELKGDFRKDKLEEVLVKLDRWLTKGSSKRSILDHTFRRLSQQEKEIRLATIKDDTKVLQRNRISTNILPFINELESADISEQAILREGIHVRFLVVCYNQAGRQKMEQFFKQIYFTGVEYLVYPEAVDKQDLQAYQFILFDFMHGQKTAYYNVLENILYDHETTILYFGRKRYPILDEDRFAERVQAANSVFSLYARIQEVSDYYKFYQEVKAEE